IQTSGCRRSILKTHVVPQRGAPMPMKCGKERVGSLASFAVVRVVKLPPAAARGACCCLSLDIAMICGGTASGREAILSASHAKQPTSDAGHVQHRGQ